MDTEPEVSDAEAPVGPEAEAPEAPEAPEAAAEDEYIDPLHIGNTVEITSDTHGYVSGRVVYRDASLVRIMPQEVSDRAVEFPMVGDGMEFSPDLGVRVVEVIATQDSDYYVDFLAAKPGETLEFFTTEGAEAAPIGVVAEVLKGPKQDSIVLTDGRILKFRGRGPPAPVAVIRVRTAVNVAAAVEDGAPAQEGPVADLVAQEARQQDVLALLQSVLPAATMEAVPIADRTFPDSLQREDLFQDLLERVKPKQRKQLRTIRGLEREVDLAVALKNQIAARDAAGRVTGVNAPLILTLQESVEDAVGPASSMVPSVIPVAIPIVRAARVLNLDRHDSSVPYKETDVRPRLLWDIESTSVDAATMYEDGSMPAAMGKGFSAYAYDMLSRDLVTLDGERSTRGWNDDQDIFRTADIRKPVQGLGAKLPNTNKGKDPLLMEVSEVYLEATVEDRGMRVLTADTVANRKSGETMTIAPSDPDTITGWTILPPKAALRLRPPMRSGHVPTAMLYSLQLESDNQPTVISTLRDLISTDISPETAWTLLRDTEIPTTIADFLSKSLRYAIHPSDGLGPRTPAVLGLLDTLGVGHRDLAPPVTAVLDKWIHQAQIEWRRLFKAERQRIKAYIASASAGGAKRIFPSVTGDDSPVWAALRQAPALKEVIADVKRRNPAIFGSSTVVAAALLMEGQGDAQPIVWSTLGALDNRPTGLDVAGASAALASSRAFHLRRAAIRGAALLHLHAEPELNNCVHVDRLEAIRNTPDVSEQARMLREFVDEFQGGKNGDWVSCAICKQDCVCYHELLDMEALAQPTRGDAIHRQVMVRFGGERYEGKIICRNCGQRLQDIDYDEHVEFDDNGRPIVEASVLTDEQMEEVPTESTWRAATKALVAAPVSFNTEGQRMLGEALTTILERGGMTATEAVIRQIVRYADLYVSARAPTQVAYDAQRTKLLTAASTKIKAGSAMPDVPTYAALLDQLRVVALTATTAMALQIAEPPIQVDNPFPLCKFSRGGWPADPTAKPDAEGAMFYTACVVASIQKEQSPWRNVAWATEPKIETRRKKALTVAIQAAQVILGADSKSAPLSFTPEIRTALTRIQTDVGASLQRAKVTGGDRLPAFFRPEPSPPALAPPAPEGNPLTAAEAIAAAGVAAPADMIDAVGAAVRKQAIASIADLHRDAVAGSKSLAGTKQTDSVCCPVPLREASLVGRNEMGSSIIAAAALLQRAQPTVPRAGTHLWEAETDHRVEVIEPTVDPSLLYQLFLKYCYTGSQVGEAHQFSTGNVCRQCGMVLGQAPDLVDVAKDGAAILAAQSGELHVEASPAAFEALSDVVRRRNLLTARVSVGRQSWVQGLQKVAEFMAAAPSHAECGQALLAVFERGLGSSAGSMDELSRANLWEPVIEHMDSLRKEVADAIGPTIPVATGRTAQIRARDALQALSMLDTITEDPFIDGPRTLQEYWCAKIEATGNSFGVRATKGLIWSMMSPDHVERIDKMLRENADWFSGELSGAMRDAMRAAGVTLGPVLRIWLQNIQQATEDGAWTVQEAQTLLRCIVLHSWRDLVSGSSWMYRGVPSSGERASVAADVADWTRALMQHIRQQYLRYSKERIAQILQQRAELERTSVVEEFQAIKDDDERAAELIKKQLRMGRWGVASKGWNKYDPELYEFENEQRKRMGIVDAPVADVPGVTGAGAAANAGGAADFGFGTLDVAPEAGYDVDQGAAGDDY